MKRTFISRKKRVPYRRKNRKMNVAAISKMIMLKPPFKVRCTGPAATDGGGAISTYIQTQVVDNAIDGSIPYIDVTYLSNLYDQFKVHAVKVRFIPSLPNNVSATTAYAPVYIAYDCDVSATNPIGSVNLALGYKNVKVKNLYRPWSVYYKIDGPTGGTYQTTGGYQDFLNIHNVGAIGIYSEGLTANTTYGTYIVECYLTCKARR